MDINLFREEKGNNPEIIRESQRRRFANVEIVDEIIKHDKEWRQCQFKVDSFRKEFNKLNKEVAQLKIAKAEATEIIQQTEKNKQDATAREVEVREAFAVLQAKLLTVGNMVHDSVPFDKDEANNLVIKLFGEKRFSTPDLKLKNHVDLVELLGIADTKRGADIAGGIMQRDSNKTRFQESMDQETLFCALNSLLTGRTRRLQFRRKPLLLFNQKPSL